MPVFSWLCSRFLLIPGHLLNVSPYHSTMRTHLTRPLLFTNWFYTRRASTRPSPAQPRNSWQPTFESLEDRRMLAVFSVSNLDDAGAGTNARFRFLWRSGSPQTLAKLPKTSTPTTFDYTSRMAYLLIDWRQCFVAALLVATLGVIADAQPITLNEPYPTTEDRFGWSVAIDGNYVLNPGTVYATAG